MGFFVVIFFDNSLNTHHKDFINYARWSLKDFTDKSFFREDFQLKYLYTTFNSFFLLLYIMFESYTHLEMYTVKDTGSMYSMFS